MIEALIETANMLEETFYTISLGLEQISALP